MHHAKLTEGLQLVFHNLTYRVPIIDPATKKPATKAILDGVTGVFQPGRLTAILGSSGAGKTSLMNVMAGELTSNVGTLTGELLVNGRSAAGHEIRKMAGYVHQEDTILHTMTVREAIMLSARLRTPSTVPLDIKRERVNNLLSFLHLNKAADTIVGNERVKGISGGERKRTCIAMELVTSPAILFLDEPTSGLDTFTAYTVVYYLKQLARAGYTVVTTLHQPSSEIFHLIDDLMLMAEGRMLYMGSAEHSVDYFASQGYVCPERTNPADYFFMSIFHTAPSIRTRSERTERLLEVWPTTPEGSAIREIVEKPRSGGFSAENRRYRSAFTEQFSLILRRTARHAFRDKMFIGMRLVQILLFAVLFSIIYWQIPDRDQSSQIQDRVGILFFSAACLITASSMPALMMFYSERSTFTRESRSGMYGLSTFFFTKLSIELPLCIITPLLLSSVIYWTTGMNQDAGRFFVYCVVATLLSVAGMGLGLVTGAFFPELSEALVAIPVIIMPTMVFSGVFVNLAGLPAWISWFKWSSMMMYGFGALLKNELEGTTIGCGKDVLADECTPMPGEVSISNLGFEGQGTVWVNISALAMGCVILTAFSYYGMWRVTRAGRGKRQPR
ncbi:P-loop containing nucleoside triphosphate hydrolase protein [Thamnocephalis sphaerospora]|uniref:P-loop containing nucleoside triphosphate hydrolase protein n=1 Tax=Thamnocephalis sphaerospora TaxID=78915 RepID=A0A4P9XJV7_9FUNG|nr:P-loop containing nucleoside triphosphate hydrolase protein [Thamnocephalis sphaerospora]|eukprot:RKP06073.1 P-loop containing nucleoside triphosphate hydrolase protein [Thamnocephalis sphaerospora]